MDDLRRRVCQHPGNGHGLQKRRILALPALHRERYHVDHRQESVRVGEHVPGHALRVVDLRRHIPRALAVRAVADLKGCRGPVRQGDGVGVHRPRRAGPGGALNLPDAAAWVAGFALDALGDPQLEPHMPVPVRFLHAGGRPGVQGVHGYLHVLHGLLRRLSARLGGLGLLHGVPDGLHGLQRVLGGLLGRFHVVRHPRPGEALDLPSGEAHGRPLLLHHQQGIVVEPRRPGQGADGPVSHPPSPPFPGPPAGKPPAGGSSLPP